MVRQQKEIVEPSPVSGVHVQQQTEVESQNFEQLAREAGHRWGLRLVAQHLARQATMGNWPGTLEEARHLVDTAIGKKIPHDERELLAMLVERGARRAWHTKASQAHVP